MLAFVEDRGVDLTHATDAELVDLAIRKHEGATRAIMQRNNQRLFRVARSVAHSDAEAEDIVQETYVRALTNLGSFRGEAQLSTWLIRIALNEALGRKRRQRATTSTDDIDSEFGQDGTGESMFSIIQIPKNPETELARQQIRSLLERAVDSLPEAFRSVLILRDVEGMSTEEVAACLALKEATVKTRLHRAHHLLRSRLEDSLSLSFASLYPFDGARCAHMADRVMHRLRELDFASTGVSGGSRNLGPC
jgi:RNA polymerase sigma-70 factor (ECF subfamily)